VRLVRRPAALAHQLPLARDVRPVTTLTNRATSPTRPWRERRPQHHARLFELAQLAASTQRRQA
jgi:hypothetical protein